MTIEADESRKAEHKAEIARLVASREYRDDYLPLWFHRRLDWLQDFYDGRDWQEFSGDAQEAYRATVAALTTRLDELTAAEVAGQEQREAEERAAQAAAEAARAAAAREAEIAARLETARVDALRGALAAMRKLPEPLTVTPVLAIVEQRIGALDDLYRDTDWQEIATGAQKVYEECRQILQAQRGAAVQAAARAVAARKAAHEAAIAAISQPLGESSEVLKQRLNYLSTVLGLRDWEEYQEAAYQAVDAEINRIASVLAAAEEREAEERAASLRQREDAARIMAEAWARDRREKNVAHRRRIEREITQDVEAVLGMIETSRLLRETVADAIITGRIRHVKVEW